MNTLQTAKRPPILVVGIGNILLHDEGIGVHVVHEMQRDGVPDYVELLDGGTAGADLLDHISDRQKVICIDAVDTHIEAPAILRLTAEDLAVNTHESVSLHEFGLAETLLMAKHLNCAPHQVVVIGVKPMDLSCGLGLSPQMKGMLPLIQKVVLAEIGTPVPC